LGKHVSRQGDLLQTYYKITSLIIHYLGPFAVGEAPASVRRTQLAAVRRKCTNSCVTRKRDSDQTRPPDTCLLEPFSFLFSITEVDEALTEGFQGIASGLI
jgi:hypothetical protein